MKAQDWMDPENLRNKIVADLMEYCVEHGLSSTAYEKKIVIQLPTVAEISVMPEHERRKIFDTSTWPTADVDEVIPDDFQLPDTGEILDEGEAPKGDQDAEK